MECNAVFTPPLVRLIGRLRSPFYPQVRCRGVRLEVGRVDQNGLWLGIADRQRLLQARKYRLLLPTLTPIVQHLGAGLVDHSQKMTVAARAMAEKKTVGQRS